MTRSTEAGCLLIAGGNLDPNINRLIEIAQKKNVPTQVLCHQKGASPAFSWHLTQDRPADRPILGSQALPVTGAFIRYDVFGDSVNQNAPNPTQPQRALGWYQAIQGWLLAQPGIRLFNRNIVPTAGNKLAVLALAKRLGLMIPETWITNEAERIQQYTPGSAIAKPVAGGGFCYALEDLQASILFQAGCAAMPAIVQNRLVPPEVRIYAIGNHVFAFEVRSQHLDYRVKQDAQVIPIETPTHEANLLRQLMATLQMDFGAADFKTHPETQQLVFLELNTSPMFVRFDRVSQGALCSAMIETLYGADESQ